MNQRRPEDWGQDALSNFLNIAYQNSLVIFVTSEWKGHYDRLRGIDVLFNIIFEGWINPPDFWPVLFFQRSYCAYLGAVRLSLSAQRPEAYMVMRGCLEAAMYGFHLHKKPSDTQIYLQRDTDAESKKACRKIFSNTKVMFEELEACSHIVGQAARELYEDAIYFGAHPNPGSIVGNVRQSQNETGPRVDTDCLNISTEPLLLCLRNNAQVGVTVLKIFGLIFSDRFAEVDAGQCIVSPFVKTNFRHV